MQLTPDAIDTIYEKHILSFSRPACCGILTWWNLKGLAELANLTVFPKRLFFVLSPIQYHNAHGFQNIDKIY